jgi:hypothetical protein
VSDKVTPIRADVLTVVAITLCQFVVKGKRLPCGGTRLFEIMAVVTAKREVVGGFTLGYRHPAA